MLIDQPLRQILQKHELSGRLARWVVELSKFDIQYKPRPSIKLQSLADFVAECIILNEDTTEEQKVTSEDELILFDQPWILHVDGSPTTLMSGAGIIFTTPYGTMFEHRLWFAFPASSNEAKYEALITSLKLTKELGAHKLKVFSDSQLVVGRVNVEFEAQILLMAKYLDKVKKIKAQIQCCKIQQILRSDNA